MHIDHKRIGFLLYDHCDALDVSGPAAVFHFARRQLGLADDRASYPLELSYFSPHGGLITTSQDLKVQTESLDGPASSGLDTVIVVGSHSVADACDPELVAWIQDNHTSVRRMAAVCTGAFVLALAGVLNGRRAATHWEDCEQLQRRFGGIEVDPNCIFIEDDGVWTSAGACAGIDMALAMIEQDYGHELALTVAKRMVIFFKRPGGQSQFSNALRSQSVAGPLGELLKWIAAHPGADLRAEALAERAHMSLRNFYRAFEEATGNSPAEWVEATRLEVAKRLLEQSTENADQIARKAGFTSYERMRRTFARRLGASPLAYREMHPKVHEASSGDLFLNSLDTAGHA